jgi:gamma-glutamylcyclotransferase (GGCT)/AIG2-like uncharacterized protein YtfP
LPAETAPLRVFVYGTLKRDQSNHERFCHGALVIEEATVRGRLYNLPYGFPALVVPEERVFAIGTTDYPGDAGKQYFLSPPAKTLPSGWATVQGELMIFDDPEKRFVALDALEGYVPGEEGLYERVLIPVEVADEVILAWAYRVERVDGIYLPGGRWPAS